MAIDPSSRNRLTPRQAALFAGETLFDKLARAVCAAGVLPRKELYEAWQVARRAHRRFRARRVVDLAAGHGLLGQLLALLDRDVERVLSVDRSLPPSAEPLSRALAAAFPALEGRIERRQASIEEVMLEPDDLVVALHACGDLSDLVLARAVAARARLALLPCCHALDGADQGGLEGWLDGPLAVDVTRVARLRAHGYRVWTQTIDPAITPKNRLLLAEPVA